MHEEMDEEKKKKAIEMIKEMGIDEEIIDERLLWVAQKVYFKLMKLRLILDEKGVEEEESKKIIGKMVDKAMEKDLAEIKKWHEEHEHKECEGKEHCC